MSRRFIPTVAVIGLAAASTIALGATSGWSAASAAGKTTPTHFALSASGYATRVLGGQVPAGSDRSAFAVIGCTNRDGLSKTNSEATVDLGGGLSLATTRTRAWTTKKGGTVASWARHSIAKLTLAGTPLGSLALSAISSTSHVWHNGSGFHSTASSSLGSIVLDSPIPGVPDVPFPVPSPGQATTIPGLATIALGTGTTRANANGASATIDAVMVDLLLTDTQVYLAHSRTMMSPGVTSALYSGGAYASRADLLDGTVTSGRTPSIVMPCQGTDGETVTKSIAHVDLATNVVGRALTASQVGGLTKQGRPTVTETSKVARVNLGGAVVITAINGSAHVEKTAQGYKRSASGTTPGKVFLNGERQTFPDTGVLEIPGIARIESKIIQRSKSGINVTAVRVTLLDGSLAVINLGFAKAGLRRSGF